MTVLTDKITPEEFVALASDQKGKLIVLLTARLLELGEQYALTSAEYHRMKAMGTKEADKLVAFADLSADYFKVQIQYDAICHAISSMQSVLKIERLGMWPDQPG